MRPSDWFLVELAIDPTPGDAFGIRGLAAKYAAIAQIAGDASQGLVRARSSGAASTWVGDAGDVFREKSHRMPGELRKATDSYEVVAAALKEWADAVDDTQAQADRGLQQAREASADRALAVAALSFAQAEWTTVLAQQLTYQKLQKKFALLPPPSNVKMPTDYQLRSTRRNADQALAAIQQARDRINDADSRLAAARALVVEAKERRDDAEQAVVHRIGQAQNRAVQPSSIWEAIQDSAAWQTVVAVATVVLTILSIVFIIIGGPLVWALIVAATVLLIVDCLLSIAQGKNAWGELALLAIGLIPGGRVLALAVHGLDGISRVGSVVVSSDEFLVQAAGRIGELTGRLALEARAGLRTVTRGLLDDTGEIRLPSRDPSEVPKPNIHPGKQDKHIPGAPNFRPGRSELTADPQELVARAGTGEPVGSVPFGEPGFKERIDFGEIIGRYASPSGQYSDTTFGILHYASDGTVHIVPGSPQP